MYNRNRNFYCGPHLCIDILLESSCSFFIASVGLFLSLITSIFCYTKIFISLCHSQVQVQDQVSRGQTSLNTAQYRERQCSVRYTYKWYQWLFVICLAVWRQF